MQTGAIRTKRRQVVSRDAWAACSPSVHRWQIRFAKLQGATSLPDAQLGYQPPAALRNPKFKHRIQANLNLSMRMRESLHSLSNRWLSSMRTEGWHENTQAGGIMVG